MVAVETIWLTSRRHLNRMERLPEADGAARERHGSSVYYIRLFFARVQYGAAFTVARRQLSRDALHFGR